jgi:hypothetical protein
MQTIVKKIKNIILSFPSKYRDATVECLTDYSRIGLRTLICSKRVISEKEYKKWKAEYKVTFHQLTPKSQYLRKPKKALWTERRKRAEFKQKLK